MLRQVEITMVIHRSYSLWIISACLVGYAPSQQAGLPEGLLTKWRAIADAPLSARLTLERAGAEHQESEADLGGTITISRRGGLYTAALGTMEHHLTYWDGARSISVRVRDSGATIEVGPAFLPIALSPFELLSHSGILPIAEAIEEASRIGSVACEQQSHGLWRIHFPLSDGVMRDYEVRVAGDAWEIVGGGVRNSGNGGGKRWRVQEWDGVLHGWALPRAGTLEFLNGDDTTTYDWHVSWSQSPHMTGLQVCSWAGACASLDGGKGKIYWRQDAAEEMVARGSLRGLQTGSPGRLQIRMGEYAVAGGWEDEQWGGIKERYADDLFAGRSLSKEVLGSRCAQAALAVLAAEMGKMEARTAWVTLVDREPRPVVQYGEVVDMARMVGIELRPFAGGGGETSGASAIPLCADKQRWQRCGTPGGWYAIRSERAGVEFG